MKLDVILKEKEVTTAKLAELTGISKRTLDEYRCGRRSQPSFENGLKIADALGIDPHELL